MCGGVLGERVQIRVPTALSEDHSILQSGLTSAFTVQRPSHRVRPAGHGPGGDQCVDECHQLVGKAYGDLSAHPSIIPDWDSPLFGVARDSAVSHSAVLGRGSVSPGNGAGEEV